MPPEDSPPPTPSIVSARRASLSAGAKMSDFWGRPAAPSTSGTSAYPGPITTAAANAQAQHQRRRTSISLALGCSPTAPPALSARNRQSSTTSSSSPGTSIEESAIEEGDAPSQSSSPTSPFMRRMSFGARAIRDARGASITGNMNGDGFDWSEQIKSRAERSASTTQRSPFGSAVVAPDEQPKASLPIGVTGQGLKDMPRPSQRQKPDHFQERILKGDFYMD